MQNGIFTAASRTINLPEMIHEGSRPRQQGVVARIAATSIGGLRAHVTDYAGLFGHQR